MYVALLGKRERVHTLDDVNSSRCTCIHTYVRTYVLVYPPDCTCMKVTYTRWTVHVCVGMGTGTGRSRVDLAGSATSSSASYVIKVVLQPSRVVSLQFSM